MAIFDATNSTEERRSLLVRATWNLCSLAAREHCAFSIYGLH